MKTVMKDKTELEILEEKKEKLDLKIKQHKRTQSNRKLRARHLIEVGALLEVAEIDQENKNTLLGYFINYKKMSKEEKEILKIQGKELLEKRKLERVSKKEKLKRSLTNIEIQELLKLSQTNNIFEVITKEFKKKLLEQLTFEEYQILIKRFN
ncbi:conjugal transfer protein TraD [Cetobacterium sp.]|uniref:conjugal transfer protein TraD n=1 Tax=Cetobacterium sp. TaxID=2071632 RepID=UPI003F2DC086